MAQKHLLENITPTREILKLGEAGLHQHAPENWLEMLKKESLQMSLLSSQRRPAVLRQTAVGSNDPLLALEMLDAMPGALAIMSAVKDKVSHCFQRNNKINSY